MTAAATLRRVRRVRATRAGAGTGITPYALYLVAMLTLIVVAPVVRSAALALAEPPVVALLRAPAAAALIAIATGLAPAGMLLLGGVRGPALMSPFLTAAVGGNDLPRSMTLRRPFLVAAVGFVVVALGGAALLSGVLADGGGPSVPTFVAFGAGTLFSALLLVVAWLTGQWLSRPVAAGTASAIAAATLVTAVIPGSHSFTPWGWAAALYPGTATTPAWPQLIGLGALAAAGLAVSRPLLDGLRGPRLLEQARRWQAAGASGAVGDLATALAQFRRLPAVGRRWKALRHRPLVVTFLIRDLVGAHRTPVRFAVAVCALAGGGYALAAVSVVPGAAAGPLAFAGSVLAYLALGVWADGFRHGIETLGQPSFYGVGTRHLLALHAGFPVLSVFLVAGAGGIAAMTMHGPSAGVLSAVCCSLFLVAVRLCDAAKGPMPPSVLTPIPTPVGDASGLVVAYWQADALLLGPAVAAGVATWASSTGWALAALVPAAAAVLLLTRSRLRR